MKFSTVMKRTVAGTFAGAMALGLLAGPTQAGTGALPAAQDSTEWAVTAGVAKGFDGDFRPEAPATRQAFMAFLARAGQLPHASGQTFSDVPPDHPFYAEIEAAAAIGVAQGFGDGTFRPNLPLSRQAAVAFLARLGSAWPSSPGPQTFSDVPPDHPFYAEIEAAWAMGIAQGFGDGTFRPGSTASRQAAATFVHRESIFAGWETWASEPLFYRAVSLDHEGQTQELEEQEIYLSFLGHRFGSSSGPGCLSEEGVYSTVGSRFEIEIIPPEEVLPYLCVPEPGIDLAWYLELLASSPEIEIVEEGLVLVSELGTLTFQQEHIDWDDLGATFP